MVLLLFFTLPLIAQDNNTPVPFTLADRDRIMRTEQRIDALEKSINVRFDAQQKSINVRFDAQQKSIDERFNALQKSIDERFYAQKQNADVRFAAQQKQLDRIYTLMMILLGAMFTLMGFILYDRRTAITPVQREQKRIGDALRQYAKTDDNLREILRKTGIY